MPFLTPTPNTRLTHSNPDHTNHSNQLKGEESTNMIETTVIQPNYGGLTPAEYMEYLKTDHWANVKTEAKMKLPRKCVACGNRGTWKRPLHLHHRNYENLWAETVGEDVIYLCQWCHKKTHRAGKKTGLGDARLSLWSHGVNRPNHDDPSTRCQTLEA